MDRIETVESLKELLELFQKREAAQKEFNNARISLQAALHFPKTAVDQFDKEHFEPFMESKIGPKPQKPTGILNQTIIVSPAKKKDYKIQLAAYERLRTEKEQEYYSEYEDVRTRIEEEEQLEIDNRIKNAEKTHKEKKQEFNALDAEIHNADFLPDKFKTLPIVQELLDYFLDNRVDTIREAINLHFEELHRRKLEEFAEQQVRLTEEAAESARSAAECASEAKDRAEEAIRIAQEAYDRANEAYDEAQNAGDDFSLDN